EPPRRPHRQAAAPPDSPRRDKREPRAAPPQPPDANAAFLVRTCRSILRQSENANKLAHLMGLLDKVKRADIRDVIATRAVSIAYQPIVDVHTGNTFAYEGLARSQSPDFKGPLELLAAAIQDKVMGELGHLLRQMTVESCPGQPLFVNVNP